MTDIARLAGVSVATVSRALAGSPLVTEETRERVAAAVRDTGYVVNRMARSLRLQEARQILVLVPNIANPFHAAVLLGAEEAAVAAGFHVLIGNTGGDPARAEEHARQLLTGAVDGMLLLGGRLPETLRAPALRRRLVAVIERVATSGIPVVEIDNQAGGREATRHLIGLGHRRIAMVAGPDRVLCCRARLDGYRAAMDAAGLPVDADLIVHTELDQAAGRAAALNLLRRPDRPTAIFTGNDLQALGVYQAARTLGLRIPADLSVVGFDDLPVAALIDPPLTTVHQPLTEMAAAATELALALGRGEQTSQLGLELATTLIVRESTAPPPGCATGPARTAADAPRQPAPPAGG
jgi:LacI family repressor for deo operon, udp, cdd, tsx, nupC, and nupG